MQLNLTRKPDLKPQRCFDPVTEASLCATCSSVLAPTSKNHVALSPSRRLMHLSNGGKANMHLVLQPCVLLGPCMSPNLVHQLRQFMRRRHLQVLSHQVLAILLRSKSSLSNTRRFLGILCNHKQAVIERASGQCCCKNWKAFKKACLNPDAEHWILAGNLLGKLLPPEQAVIAEGSLVNKVFPPKI